VAILRPDADEVLRDDPLTKELVESCLKICLLAFESALNMRRAVVADEPESPAKNVSDVLRRPVTELATPFGYECRPDGIYLHVAHRVGQGRHFAYRRN
jgi:hypothetical protein